MGCDPSLTQGTNQPLSIRGRPDPGETLEFGTEPDNDEIELTCPVRSGELEGQRSHDGITTSSSPWTTRDPRDSRLTMTVSSVPRPAVTRSGPVTSRSGGDAPTTSVSAVTSGPQERGAVITGNHVVR